MNDANVVSFERARRTDDDRIGSIELGCFRLKEIIGQGSYGTSYLAEQIGFDRDAVVKLAHPELFRSRDAGLVRRRFADELQAATRVQHPHLVTLYTAGETADGIPAIAMELAPGHPLEDRLAAQPKGLSGELIEPAFAQLGSALVALHDAGVVHRDLSPSNVMLDGGPPVKITVLDFGVAKLRGRPRQTYGAVGTPRYMAPEQVIGRAGPASDVFAMGAMLWWALTGKEYRADALTIEDLHHAALTTQAGVDPRSAAPDIPEGVATLVGRMLAHSEYNRPSAKEFCVLWAEVAPTLRTLIPRPAKRPPPPPPPPRPKARTVSAPPSFGTLRDSLPPSSSTASKNGPRVLVIDANSITRHLVVGCMRRAGCRVQGSSDPRQATRSEAGSFDMVVLSTEITDADPHDVAHHLREYHPKEWLVLTGPGTLDPALRDAGVRDIVAVPAGFERLSELVDQLRGELALRKSSAPSEIDAIDRSVLDQLHHDDPTIVREAIELFLGQAPENLAQIDDANQQRDREGVLRECQSLSTSARALGANHLARLAHAAAELIREGDLDCIPGFVTEMEREYGLVFRALMDIHGASRPERSL